MNDLRSLPEFENPPVVELVLDVQFQPISSLDVPRLGLLWQVFRSDFPQVEQHGPLTPLVERFGPGSGEEGRVFIEPFAVPMLPRLWFLDAKGTELIQVQNNRFVHNWRRTDQRTDYPHYDAVRSRFRTELEKFEAFMHEEGLGELVPELCEISYFNHIEPGEAWHGHEQLHEVLRLWKPDFGDDFTSDKQLESASVNFQFIMKNEQGDPYGRWRVSVQPGYARDGESPIFVITNTARGRPLADGIEGAIRFLDQGHDWTVRGFAAMTTENVHRLWGRTNGH